MTLTMQIKFNLPYILFHGNWNYKNHHRAEFYLILILITDILRKDTD